MTITVKDDSDIAAETVAVWLRDFSSALADADAHPVGDLFAPDGYWRDALALTWGVHTFYGVEQITAAMEQALASMKITDVRVADQSPPRRVRRAGVDVIEAIFEFETSIGRGRGVVRFVEGADDLPRAWTLLTALEELSGHEESIGAHRPNGLNYSRTFDGPNWLDLRTTQRRYDKTDPAVLIVGGGQAGLAAAARLKQLDVDTLIVDRIERVGDNWRNRYHSLTLHNEVWVCHLPYMPFPDTWPTYVPKDKLANWFEAYVESLELNFWTSTGFVTGVYDTHTQTWNALLRDKDGSERVLHPRHIIMATGVSGIPSIPAIPGLDDFRGDVLHSSAFDEGSEYHDKRVLVMGTGTSGHDVAQDLHSHGAQVTLVQRNETTVTEVGVNGAGKVYALYSEGLSTEDCDLITVSTPYPLLRRSYQLLSEELAEQDSDLLAGLRNAGFKIDFGEDNTGFQMKYLSRGGGYYLNVGCSELICNGQIGLMQSADIDHFDTTGAVLRNGERQDADAVILATGYKGQQELVRLLYGNDVADRVGPVWGFNDEGELRNMWTRTPQEGLWFIAGSLAQCRIFSKYLALQIKGCEEGLLPKALTDDEIVGSVRPNDVTHILVT